MTSHVGEALVLSTLDGGTDNETTPVIGAGVINQDVASPPKLSLFRHGTTSPTSVSEGRPDSASSARVRPSVPSNHSSRRNLLYPQGDFRHSSMGDLKDLKTDMMCSWLYQQQMERMWTTNGLEEGVFLRKARDDYKCAPEDLASKPGGIYDAVRRLNVKVRYLSSSFLAGWTKPRSAQ
jgi:hypothetical protein